MPCSHTANESVGHISATLTKGRDPSNTHELQKAFLREAQRRLREVRGAIRRTVAENDALRLRANADAEEAYDYPTEDGRRDQFLRDLRRWIRTALLGEDAAANQRRPQEHWLAEYVREAYQVGLTTAEGRLMQVGVSLTASDPEDLLRRPISQQQLADLYSRTFENLKGVSEEAARELRQTLTGGLAAGTNPRQLASDLNSELRSIERDRLATIARTEIMRSHADATVQTYREHSVNVVNHTSRLTAKDASVCAFCRALDGIPFTLSEFQSVTVRWGSQLRRIGVPAHPSGRCSPMPEVGIGADGLPPLPERLPDSAGGRPITIIGGG